jgi:hypothetical protein
MEQVNGADPTVAAQDAKMMYMERVYKMTHAELFHELMRVHTESAKMIMDLQKEIESMKEAAQDNDK